MLRLKLNIDLTIRKLHTKISVMTNNFFYETKLKTQHSHFETFKPQ